jgi:hypothetical protein
MAIDLDKIERDALAAKAAAPNRWDFSWGDGGLIQMHSGGSFSRIIDCRDDALSDERIGYYLARVEPDAVLELVQQLRDARAAVAYLYNTWAGAEGEGQPHVWVFGNRDELGDDCNEGAPDNIKAATREALGK